MRNTLIVSRKATMLEIIQAALIQKKTREQKNRWKSKMCKIEKMSDPNKQNYYCQVKRLREKTQWWSLFSRKSFYNIRS